MLDFNKKFQLNSHVQKITRNKQLFEILINLMKNINTFKNSKMGHENRYSHMPSND